MRFSCGLLVLALGCPAPEPDEPLPQPRPRPDGGRAIASDGGLRPDAGSSSGDDAGSDAGPDADAGFDLHPVDVTVTADNAYSFGYGTASSLTTYVQGRRALVAGEIFNCGPGPDAYRVPAAGAPRGAFLYLIVWDDLQVTQGVLGQFVRGSNLLVTGATGFEVCATGVDLSASTVGPTQAEVNAQLAVCNAGTGDRLTTSAGWVDARGPVTSGAIGRLVVGEANDRQDGTFPLACPPTSSTPDPTISSQARWMWYSPGGNVGDPFWATGTNSFRAYLIFRIASETIGID